jgi:hypothetical protein
MVKRNKLFKKILSGSRNIRFDEFVGLMLAFGFRLDRISGSHQIYIHPVVLRPFPVKDDSGKAKPYQVKQFLKLVEQYNLKLTGADKDDDEDVEGDEE